MSTRPGWRRALLAAATLVALVPPPNALAAHAVRPEAVPRAKRLFMVSDSVGLGAIPQLQRAFAGWAVNVTGKPGLFTEMLVRYVNDAPASAFGDDAIVATGYNYPYWDGPRFDRSVDLMVSALHARGVKHIYWVTVREVKPEYYSHWNGLTAPYRTLYLAYPHTNDQLRAATKRHPNLSIIDWASVSDQAGLTYDAIHLNPTGATLYATLAQRIVTTGDTRTPAGTITQLVVGGAHGVPADARAVAVNLTAVNPQSFGTVSAYPCGAAVPAVANLLLQPGRTTSVAAVVQVPAGGKICIRQSTAAHLTLDLTGAFTATSGFRRTAPRRVLDASLATGASRTVHLGAIGGAPATPFVAVVGLTASATSDGQAYLFTCGSSAPAVATRSYARGQRNQVLQLVRTDAHGDVCVRSSGGARLSLDLFGWFDGAGDLHSVRTRRVLDTRTAGGPLLPGVARTVQLGGIPFAPASPTGAVVTVTLLGPSGPGSATVYPCGLGGAATSVVDVVPNHAAAGTVLASVDGKGRVCVRSNVRSQVTVDVSAWTGRSFVALRHVRLLDTRN